MQHLRTQNYQQFPRIEILSLVDMGGKVKTMQLIVEISVVMKRVRKKVC